MGKIYYPLSKCKAVYKLPMHHAVITSDDSFDHYGVIWDKQFEVLTRLQVVDFILSLPKAAWVYTYNSHWITQLFANYLDRITRLEAIGDYQCTTIENEFTHVYVVDLFQITMDSLRTTAKKLGIELASQNVGLNDYLKSKVSAIENIKDLYNQAVKETWGIHPSKTIGATSLKSWRATLPDQPELKIRGRRPNKLSRSAIRPGGLNWKQGYYPRGYSYDINGSYINAMRTIKLPIWVRGFSNRQPGARWVATVKLNYKTDLQWGVLPVRSTTGSYFRPTEMKDYVTSITYLDYFLMQMTGEVEITQWLEGITWNTSDEYYLFEPWITQLVKSSDNPKYKYLLKNVSRALHSKFAQNVGGSSVILIKPKNKAEVQEYLKNKQLIDIIFTDNGGTILQVNKPYVDHFIPFMFPQWEAIILAAGRLQLYSNIDENTIYTDTDSIISTQPRGDLFLSKDIGAWKLEAEGETAIIAPRSYVCGGKVKCAGIRATDIGELKNAIITAAMGGEKEIEKVEMGNIIKQTKTKYKMHTIRVEKYPHVKLDGNILSVTRSPTVLLEAVSTNRLFSIDIE